MVASCTRGASLAASAQPRPLPPASATGGLSLTPHPQTPRTSGALKISQTPVQGSSEVRRNAGASARRTVSLVLPGKLDASGAAVLCAPLPWARSLGLEASAAEPLPQLTAREARAAPAPFLYVKLMRAVSANRTQG